MSDPKKTRSILDGFDFASAITEQVRLFSQQMAANVQQLFKDSIAAVQEFERQMNARCEQLAELGWTIPMEMTPKQVVELSLQTVAATVDELFLSFYGEPANFQRLRRELIESPELVSWKPLLMECFSAYERMEHRICIPALITIIEGSMDVPYAGHFRKQRKRTTFFKAKIAAAHDPFEKTMWRSLKIFVEHLFRDVSLNAARPSRLNRHWILHGRDLPEQWQAADALRLFNALSTLTALETPVITKHKS